MYVKVKSVKISLKCSYIKFQFIIIFQKTNHCMKYIWFKRKHLKPTGIPGQYTTTSSSSLGKRPKPTTQVHKPSPTLKTKPIQHKQSPCAQGIKYICFSLATAKHCKYVSVNWLRASESAVMRNMKIVLFLEFYFDNIRIFFVGYIVWFLIINKKLKQEQKFP